MEQALSFEGTGLDLDNNYSTFSPGDSPFRLNCRYGTTDRSDLGGIQNFKGNTRLTMSFEGGFFIQPPGENRVIGSTRDAERNAIIYFVWNENGLHQIRRYYTQTQRIQVILESPVLNFQLTNKIVHANVVDKYLSWTDGWQDPNNEFNYNPPIQIDMEKAYGFMQGLPFPDGYTTIDRQTLSAIRYAPGLCPTFQYVNDLNFNDNRLYGHLFQFGYRWVYYDNSKSVISPLSKLTLPQGEDFEGNYVFTEENRLDVTVETGHYTVVRIELVAKEGTSWKVVDEIEKYGDIPIPSDSTYTIQFFNTKFIAEIPIGEALRPFDFLPQTADAQEVISAQQGARRIYGSYTEGYANVPDFDMEVDVKIEKIDPASPNYKNVSFKRKGSYSLGVVYSDEEGRKSFVQANDKTKAVIPWWRSTELIAEYYDATDEWILSTHQKPYIEWNLNSSPPEWAKTYQVVCSKDITTGSKNHVFMNFGVGTANFEKGYFLRENMDAVYIPSNVGYDFTTGDRIRLIAQFDNSSNPNIEDFGVNFTPEPKTLGVVIPLVTTDPTNPYQVNTFQTYNDPNNEKWDFKIRKFDPTTNFAQIEGEMNLVENTFYIFQIYNSVTEISEQNIQYFEVGETYPIINGNHSVVSGRVDGVDTFVRSPIYKYDTFRFTGGVLGFQRVSGSGTVGATPLSKVFLRDVKFGFSSGSSFILSMAGRSYTPPNNSVIVGGNTAAYVPQCVISDYIESPDILGINTVFRVASGGFTSPLIAAQLGTTIQLDVDNSAEIKLNAVSANGYFGAPIECKCKFQVPNVDFEIKGLIYELSNYSDFYESEVDQTGRPYIINKEAIRRKYFANMIFGGQFFDNTLLNFFSRYESQNVEQLNERYNEITRLHEVGFMLKVRQRNKSTSIYIGRTELTNTTGSSNVAASNSVLGTINPSDEVWGGTNGTTDVKSIRDTYFFDYINGVVVRDATNGLVAISGNLASPQDPYKMTAFFRDMSQYISENLDTTETHSGWDNNTQSYYFTLRKLRKDDTIPQFISKYKLEEAWDSGLTLSFHETSNRWQTFHSFVPEHYASIGNNFLCFLEGEAWLAYSNEVRNSYFDTTYPTVTAQICNQNTNNIKVFDNIDVYSNRKWSCPELSDIFILPNAQFINGMRSKLEDVHFVGKEGKWHASFLRDINTPGYTNTLLALMGGRRLRGEAMKATLRNNDTKEVFMRQVIFHFTLSEMSG